ncbi:MAG: ABC transporter ATP-binding protein [Anaerolineales bacterium]|nr:ABC transporter ATP-binding protein [Anaerolineales bacterium]
MSDIAIRVENLGKRYQIGARQERPDTLRDALTGFFRRPKKATKAETELWALKDVSFEVKRGEVVGIIGRNGAGKSTLLKILSRITEPTHGKALIHGRVGSLLEVGTGFHPELTGRENIYLSGAMLGMKREEIARKFDEIVDFSGVEKFIDTPIKRYSSGMNVRLGFAVAAHLEPEIILVDEVLAVGDAEFQKKCLGKMQDMSGGGKTVLFVSHNMAAIIKLCNRSILLQGGNMIATGKTADMARTYLHLYQKAQNQDLNLACRHAGDGKIVFTSFTIRNSLGKQIESPMCGEEIKIELGYKARESLENRYVIFSIGFYNLLGQSLFLCRSDLQGTHYSNLPKEGIISCRIPKMPLPPGEFQVNLQCQINDTVADWIIDALTLSITEGDFYGSGRLPNRSRGDLLIHHEWLPPNQRQG